MRDLIEEYGAAVAARARLERRDGWLESRPEAGRPLCDAREREAKARDALEDAVAAAVIHIGEAVSLADDVRHGKRVLRADDRTIVAYESQANSRVGGERFRAPTLKDAKRNAEMIARRLREAWEILDPSLPSTFGVEGRKP